MLGVGDLLTRVQTPAIHPWIARTSSAWRGCLRRVDRSSWVRGDSLVLPAFLFHFDAFPFPRPSDAEITDVTMVSADFGSMTVTLIPGVAG
jgi:hypothetical protein